MIKLENGIFEIKNNASIFYKVSYKDFINLNYQNKFQQATIEYDQNIKMYRINFIFHKNVNKRKCNYFEVVESISFGHDYFIKNGIDHNIFLESPKEVGFKMFFKKQDLGYYSFDYVHYKNEFIENTMLISDHIIIK